MEIYTGNTDLLNNKKYRSTAVDGKWRWIVFDFDWAFTTDTNSVGRWLKSGGVGESNKRDNSLFIALMKNPVCKDYFLTLFSEKLKGDWSTASVLQKMAERYQELLPELPMHLERWGKTEKSYNSRLNELKKYTQTRPGRLLYFYSNALSKAEFEKYFGEIARTVQLIDDKGKSYSYYK